MEQQDSGVVLQLFGPLRITVDGVPRPRPKTMAAELVLASLVLADGRPISRALLAGRVWPEADAAKARHSLSQALSTLRNLLPPQAIHTHPGGLLSVDLTDWSVDVLEFRRLAQSNSPEAIRVYQDDLLPHIDHPWVAAEQSSLARILTELYDAHEDELSEEEAENVRRILGISIVAPAHAVRNLPSASGRFFGREAEMEEIERHLSGGARAVTLIAPGGFGKSRLAMEAARRLRFDAFAALADSPTDINVAELTAEWQPCERLVLDNCEHLDDNAVAHIESLLASEPNLQVLATSRRPLGIEGEVELVLNPLPPASASHSVRELGEWGAFAMLLDRAGIALDELSDGHVRRVLIEICHKLDGIPLALELVAQRLRRRPFDEVLALLDRQLLAVETTQINRPARHRSLEAALSSSIDSLSRSTRAALEKLCVIPSGFELSLAEAMVGDEAEERLDLLHRSGLVRRQRQGGVPRHRLIDAVRERVLDELDAATRSEAEAQLRHWTSARMEIDRPNLIGPMAGSTLAAWDQRRDILRLALSATPPEEYCAFVLKTGRYWVVRGLASEGREWFERGVDLAADASIKAEFWESLGVLRTNAGDHQSAVEALQTAIQMKRELGDEEALVRAQINLASILRNLGRSQEVLEILAETLDSPVVEQNPYVKSVSLSTYANALTDLKQDEQAETALRELIEIKQSLGDQRGLLISRGNLAHVLTRRERHDEALVEITSVLTKLIEGQDWVPAIDFAVTLAQILEALNLRQSAAEALGFASSLCMRAGTSPSKPTQQEIDAVQARLGVDLESNPLRGAVLMPDEYQDWLFRLAI